MTACRLCARTLQPIPGAPDFIFCQACDRRKCEECGYSEQDTGANRCSHCRMEYSR